MTLSMLKHKPERDFVTDLLISKFYKSKDLFLEDALTSLLLSKNELRHEVAIEAYVKEKTSLWGASELADMPLDNFKKLLAKKHIKIIAS